MKRIVSLLLIFGLFCLFSCQNTSQTDTLQPTPPADNEENAPTATPDTPSDDTPEADTENDPAPPSDPPSKRTLRLQKLTNIGIPTPEEEFRGLWVAFSDINALLKGADAEKARAALDQLMDDCIENRLNTVIFHVRVNSDAYYLSDIFHTQAA